MDTHSLKLELRDLLAHKGELHRQIENLQKSLDSLDVLINHTEAKLINASRQEKSDAHQVP